MTTEETFAPTLCNHCKVQPTRLKKNAKAPYNHRNQWTKNCDNCADALKRQGIQNHYLRNRTPNTDETIDQLRQWMEKKRKHDEIGLALEQEGKRLRTLFGL